MQHNPQEQPWSHKPTRLLWWDELNAELAARGEKEALLGDANYFFEKNYSPMTAAQLIAQDRKETA